MTAEVVIGSVPENFLGLEDIAGKPDAGNDPTLTNRLGDLRDALEGKIRPKETKGRGETYNTFYAMPKGLFDRESLRQTLYKMKDLKK